ncbi:acetate--CoA ligase family protein [Leucobacter sp. HY1908]
MNPRVTHDLNAFHDPASVAVIGASSNPAKWGHWLAMGAGIGRTRRRVYLINSAGGEIAGMQSYPSLDSLPEVPELLAIAVPGHLVLEVMRDALSKGVRAFLVVAAQMHDEAAAAQLLSEYGARMIGPNSLGIYSAEGELQLMWGSMRPGSLAIISQSGQLGSEIAALGVRAGVGISRFVSLGNQTDVHATEVIRSVAGDSRTKTIGLYLEDFAGAGELFAAVREAAAAGVRVLLLTTGESAASRQLAQSHTGAMTSPMDLVDAACRAAGALRVSTPSDLVQIASYLDRVEAPEGPRIAVISDSGGQGGIAADQASHLGLELPPLSDALRTRMHAMLSEQASTRNPIDLAGSGEANLNVYVDLARLLAESGEVDAVVVSGYFCSYGHDTPALHEAEATVAARFTEIAGAPVVVHAMAADSRVAEQLRDTGVPVYGRIEDALLAITAAYELAARTSRIKDPATARPALHQEVAPIAGGSQADLRAALVTAGFPFPVVRTVRTAHEAAAAANELGGAVVLKAAWLAHKTEAGGVALGLTGPEATAAAFESMHARIGDGAYTIEAQDTREHVAEFIVAARRDPAFGPVISVGYGGTETEVWEDLRVELAPVSLETARGMIDELRSAKLLAPWRGRPALDRDVLARVVSDLSHVLAASPAVGEIELNPVRVGPDSAIIVDCLAE